MRVVSRLLVAVAIVALPRLITAQRVAPAAMGLRTPATPSERPQYVPPEGVQAPTTDAVAHPATDRDQTVDHNGSDVGHLAGAAGPSLMAATAGIRTNTAKEDLTAQEAAQRAAHHGGFGPGALMIVGAVAFIAGVIIGGGAGTAIAIAGAAVGLYGLFLYVR